MPGCSHNWEYAGTTDNIFNLNPSDSVNRECLQYS